MSTWARHRWVNAELLKDTQSIGYGPVIHKPALDKPQDHDTGIAHCFACRRNTAELALVSTPASETYYYLVIFSDHILNGIVQIWKGPPQERETPFHLLPSSQFFIRIVNRNIWGEQLIDFAQISLAKDFIQNAVCDNLILCS